MDQMEQKETRAELEQEMETDEKEDEPKQETEIKQTEKADSVERSSENEDIPQVSVEKSSEKEDTPQESVEKSSEKEGQPQESVEKSSEKENTPQESVEKSSEKEDKPRESEEKSPEKEDKTRESEEKSPEKEDKTRESEENSPEKEDKTRESEKKSPEKENKTRESEEKSPEKEDTTRESEEKSPEKEDKTRESEEKSPEKEDTTRESEEKSPEKEDTTRESEEKSPEKEDTTRESEEKLSQEKDTSQKSAEKLSEKEDTPQESVEKSSEKEGQPRECVEKSSEKEDTPQEGEEKSCEKEDTPQEGEEKSCEKGDTPQEGEESIQDKSRVEEVKETNKELPTEAEIASGVGDITENTLPETTATECNSETASVEKTESSNPESSPQHQTETSGGFEEDKNAQNTSGCFEQEQNAHSVYDSSSIIPKENSETGFTLPIPKGDTFEDSLTELKQIFESKNKKNTDSPEESPSKTNKSAYEDQFEKFILQTNPSEKPVSDVEQDSNNESSENTNKEKEDFRSSNVTFKDDLKSSNISGNFKLISEETSNSSWYKIGSNGEQPMEISEPVMQEDISNLSAPDNASVVSSNIGDSCMSFQDQGSNIDESSNLSVPEDSVTVAQYTGHTPDFDESANMNPPSNVTFIRPDTPSSVITDTMSESTPAKKTRRGTLQIAVDEASDHGHNITAADVYEYQWPQEKDAEYYILQEQLSIFLDIKSFKRKYPDLFRRVCDKHEKDYLREKGVVSETQSDLGLTALKSDEVYDLMSRDYPAKYKEFLKVIHEKERQRMASKMKEHDALKLEKDKMIEYTKRAMKSASDWNRNMLKERNEERRAYFDMQTFSIQYPKSKFRKLENVGTGVTAYPLSLIPGQFQDYYRKYNSEELKYFPLNTTLFDPPKKVDHLARQRQQEQMEEEMESQDDGQTGTGSVSGSESEDDSSSSSDESDYKENGEGTSSGRMIRKKEKSSSRETSKEKSVEMLGGISSLQPVVKLEVMECRICKEDKGQAKQKIEEEMIRCSECKSTGHPSCLDLTDEMVKIIKTYPWQCMECKTCVECMDPYDEDKMMFCDKCDRGYHTFCVGLKSLPTGHWECKSCRGDSTPVKPIPRPTPKSKRGRKPKSEVPIKEESQSKDKPAKDSPARDRPERSRSGKETPTRDKTATKEAKDRQGLKDKNLKDRPVIRESIRGLSRESSRSSMKDNDN